MYWKKCIYPYRFKALFGFLFKLSEAILEL